jgi:Tfp pilus assembly protein FimT
MVSSATNEFIVSLNLAISEALKSSNNVSVCKSNPAYSACAGVGTVASYSANGWLVTTDCNSDGIINNTGCPAGETDTILKVGESNEAINMVVQFDFVTYNLSGRIDGGGEPSFIVETHTSNATIKKNKITINRIGRVKTCRVGDTGC